MSLQTAIEKRASVMSQSMGTATADIWSSPKNTAGVTVNERTAFGLPALYCAVKVIAESMGQLPLNLYKRTKDGREKIYDRLWSVVAEQANTEQSAAEFFEFMTSVACLRGVAYAEIELDKRTGEVVGLWPLPPGAVTRAHTPSGAVFYKFRNPIDQIEYILPADSVLKLPGFCANGLEGLNIVDYFATTIGLGLAMQEHTANFFAHGAKPGVVLETPLALDPKIKENLERDWEQRHGGLSGKHRIAILHQGMKLKEFALTNEASQLLESRKFAVVDVCRLLRMPPHMVMDLEKATFSNIEHQSTQFVTHTMAPWGVRFEQRLKMQLMTTTQASDHYFKFNFNGFLRGDTTARKDLYREMIAGGVFCPDDVLELEDRNPQPNGIGKVYRRDMNARFVGPGASSIPAEAQGEAV